LTLPSRLDVRKFLRCPPNGSALSCGDLLPFLWFEW
jgi:hypothetical protein